MSSNQTFAIVGASLAGARAAETLRQEGFDGRVVLLGAEPERPYERPPLSKDYVRGDSPRDKTYVHPADFYDEHGIGLRTATPVQAIDTTARELALGSGERLGFDRLLLATGAEPRRLQVPGSDLDGVFYLRDLHDADAIAERIARGGKLVVIGGGWIGAELAASAREKGLEVTVIEGSALPLQRVLGAELGAVYRDLHLECGVQWRFNTGIEAFEGDRAVERVRTTDGTTIDCDFVVVGIGVTPRTALAEAAGIEVDNGILVNDRLETSVPGIFAAGDVANAWQPFYGRRIRVEHWANARNQGPAAAKAMFGQSVSYDRLPYFYSDQYDMGMEYSGYAPRWDEVVFRGDPAKREFIAFWLEAGRVVAGMNVNVWEVTDPIQALIRSGEPVDPARLRDPDAALADLAARPVLRNPARSRSTGSPRELLSQGVTVAKRFLGARLAKPDRTPVAELSNGEGRVLTVEGQRLAVYKNEHGELQTVSAVCTHLGCIIDWNSAERTWDCACHGSRFHTDGTVIQGPAKKPLAPKSPFPGSAPPAPAPTD